MSHRLLTITVQAHRGMGFLWMVCDWGIPIAFDYEQKMEAAKKAAQRKLKLYERKINSP